MNAIASPAPAKRPRAARWIAGRLAAGLALGALALMTASAVHVHAAAAYAPPAPVMLPTPGWTDLGPSAVCYEIVGDDMYKVDCNPPVDLGPDD